jgi:NAD(P)-dependent dehydrogenase (short-subunit alcohol dehydrogenase family)
MREDKMGMLNGKVAFITGAASGIGAGTARRFAQEGANVAIADVQTDAGERLCAELKSAGAEALYTHCDVSDSDSVRDALDATLKRFGQLHIVCANAGINLRGTYLTVHHAVPHLKRAGGGSIIVTSSVNGNRTFSTPGASAYSTSKAGQVAFTKMIALELGRDNIRCNVICPGLIHTQIERSTEQRNTERLRIEVELPAGSPALHSGEGDPEDVADTCVFLASDLGRHVSGVELYVDGGASLLR